MIKQQVIVGLICLLNISVSMAADLGKVLEKGFIEIAVYENFPPYSFKGDDGRVAGIDVDLGRAIADELGVQVGFRLFTADESVDDDLRNVVWKGHYLAGGPADLMMHAPYDPNFASGNDKVAFLQPYHKELIAFAIDTSRVRSARTLEVFIDEPIGVETATLADAYLLGAFGGRLRDNVRHFTTVNDAAKAMVGNEISAIMASRGELEYSLGKFQHDFVISKLPTPGLNVKGWELCVAVNSDHVELAQRLNEIIGKLKLSGKIDEIFKSYGITYNVADSNKLLNVAEHLAGTQE